MESRGKDSPWSPGTLRPARGASALWSRGLEGRLDASHVAFPGRAEGTGSPGVGDTPAGFGRLTKERRAEPLEGEIADAAAIALRSSGHDHAERRLPSSGPRRATGREEEGQRDSHQLGAGGDMPRTGGGGG